MNPRTIGKIFIAFGLIMLLAYVGWIVFRVVRQPDQVAENGLLPNPFDLVIPGVRTQEPQGVTPVGQTPDNEPQLVPVEIAPDKRLFRISSEPAHEFTVFESMIDTTSTNPITGETTASQVPVQTVRYTTRDEGFVIDAVVGSDSITEKRLSSAFVSGLYSVDMNRYLLAGMYRTRKDTSSTAYTLALEDVPIKKGTSSSVTSQSVCRYVLNKVTLGGTGRDVESVQQILIASGLRGPYVAGVFDEAMKSQIVDYQKLKKITPTSGIVGVKTLAQLQSDCNELLPTLPEPEGSAAAAERDQSKIRILPKGVYHITVLDHSRIFMLLNSAGRNKGVVRDTVSGGDTEVYSLGFVDWNSTLFDSGRILLSTRPSGLAPGYVFLAGIANKSLVPVLQNITGLAVVPSPDSKYILYSSTEGGAPTLTLYVVATRESIPINIQTFAEKCTWTLDSSSIYCMVPSELPEQYVYPDEWYKRGLAVSDSLTRYSVDTQVVEGLDTLGEIPAIRVDGIDGKIVESQSMYVFRDWKSGYIWGYRLN
jgi:peptidoglycan hydrolase-like protein with peptidoglycan-binding domain